MFYNKLMKIFFRRPLAFCTAMFILFFVIMIYLPAVAVQILLAIGIAALIILLLRRRRFDKLTGAFVALSAASLLCLIWSVVILSPARTLEHGYYEAVLEVNEISYQSDNTAYFTAELESLNGESFKYDCKLNAEKLPCELRSGDKLSAVVEMIPFADDKYGFDESSYYRSKNIWLSAVIEDGSNIQLLSHTEYHLKNAVQSIRDRCVESFERYTDDDSAAFLAALTIGDKSGLDASVKRDMTRLGISHMLAISGMHLAIIMGCIVILISLMGFDRYKGSAVVIILCIAYIIISGANASVLRSGIMFILMSMSCFSGRDNDSLTSLFTAVSCIIIASPASVFDVGLILSFTSSFGIIVIAGDYLKRLGNEKNTLRRGINAIKLSLVTTLSAMTFSLIPILIYFSTFSTISVFTNLLFTPFITVILFGIIVFLAVSPITLFARVVGLFLDMTVSLFLYLAKYISRLSDISVSLRYPFIIFALAAFAIGVVIAYSTRKRIALLLPYILWLTVYICGIGIYNLSYNGAADMLFLSENNNDAILIRSGSETVYVDLGKADSRFSNKAFSHLDVDLYSAELDHWMIARYSDKEIGVIADGLGSMRVHNLYIPHPCNGNEEVIAEELKYYCELEGTVLTYYSYDLPLILSDMSITITEPHTVEDTALRIFSASVDVGDESAVYYSSGYFEFSDEYADSDIVIIGAAGSGRKQTASPDISCDRLVVAGDNKVAAENIECKELYPFDAKNTFCKIRIG